MKTPPPPRLQMSIGATLAIGFGSLILLAVAAVLYLGATSARQNTHELLGYITEQSLDSLNQQLESQLNPVVEAARWMEGEVESGRADPLADKAGFDLFVAGSLAAVPQVRLVAYVSPDEQLSLYDRAGHKVVSGDLAQNSVAFERYRRLGNVSKPTWDEPFWSPSLQQMIIILVSPLTRGGKRMGAIAQAITVADLSLQLASKGEQLGLVPYILYDRDRVLAHPSLIGWRQSPEEHEALPSLEQVNDAVLREVWNESLRFEPDLFITLTKSNGFGLDLGGRHFLFAQRTLTHYGPRPWTLGAYLPASAVSDLRDRLVNIFIGALAVLALTILLALWLGRMVSLPVRRLGAAARQISGGEVARVRPLAPSALREIDEAADAFNSMVIGIRERDLIRSVFGKYVPASVAARLLDADGALQPTLTEATILFADIEGFTEISGALQPVEIVEMLNAFFSVLAAAVEKHDGVITQFQGDAILATFNVPLRKPDHAAQAVLAAIEMRDAVAGRSFAGHRLNCRIGINTGEVVAGTVGASDRLNYTVHGDAVNVAARIEELNKGFGTRILLSETTARALSGIALADLGEVPIRGKKGSLRIFTVADERPEAGSA